MEYRIDCRSQNFESKQIMDLLEFRLSLGEYLVAGTNKRVLEETDEGDNSENDINQGNKIKKRRVAASLSCGDKRLDGFEHRPNNEDMKNLVKCRLEGCESRSRIRCTKCNVFLCLSKNKNCFVSFHKN
ncbi:hypothetical protein JTB14_034266 [Gonioctena quinquepunctata]|nr:hypothetical protein JTB14_034266 [Gonioctena quinquepunctata]